MSKTALLADHARYRPADEDSADEGLLGLVLSVLLAFYAGKAIWLALGHSSAERANQPTSSVPPP